MIYDINGNPIQSGDTGGAQWSGKKWYAYGTSLTQRGQYTSALVGLSSLQLANKGIGGGKIVGSSANIRSAVMNTTDGKLEADLITLEVGANDTSETIGTIYDTGNTTFCGALNQCIQYLQANTNAQIVVMSSTRSRYASGSPSDLESISDTYGSDNHTKFDQWEATRKCCEVNSVYYIPFGDGLGLGLARMQANNLYLVDNIHHTALGGYNIAQGIWGYLKNIPLWYTAIPSN